MLSLRAEVNMTTCVLFLFGPGKAFGVLSPVLGGSALQCGLFASGWLVSMTWLCAAVISARVLGECIRWY